MLSAGDKGRGLTGAMRTVKSYSIQDVSTFAIDAHSLWTQVCWAKSWSSLQVGKLEPYQDP